MGATSELYIRMQDEIMQTISQVENGEVGYLDGFISLREKKSKLEDTLEIIKDFEDHNQEGIAREAAQYTAGYKGVQVTLVQGRKTYSFKNIPQWNEAEKYKKEVEECFKSAFEGFQKGIQPSAPITGDENSPLGWVDGDGAIHPFPEISYGKSFFKVQTIKSKR